MKFKMLDLVEDISSGYRGRVTGYTQGLVGVLQANVQGALKADGSPGDSYGIDEPSLKLVEAWTGDKFEVSFDKAKFEIGETLEHLSGFKGKVTSLVVTLHGCYMYRLTSLSSKGEPVYETFNEPGLKSLKKTELPKEKARTGGPSSKLGKSRE